MARLAEPGWEPRLRVQDGLAGSVPGAPVRLGVAGVSGESAAGTVWSVWRQCPDPSVDPTHTRRHVLGKVVRKEESHCKNLLRNAAQRPGQ